MRSRERLALIAVLLLAAIFLVTVTTSILRRTETTYSYPAYSSLNNSNDGTKAFFETLGRLGYRTTRNYRPLHKLDGTQADVFYAGPGLGQFRYTEGEDLEDFERLAKGGARLILALDTDGLMDTPVKTAKPEKGKDQTPEDVLKQRWEIDVRFKPRRVDKSLERFLTQMHSAPVTFYFASWSGDWTPSQMRDGAPLFLEHHFGRGSILLIAGAKLFTNRELLVKPDTAVLAAIPGLRREIIFDESHLGLEDTGTVVGLATAHHMDWMLLGFAVLAGLYVWRSSASFLPPLESAKETAVAGHDAHTALSNLLLQSVPKKFVLRAAAEEWNSSIGAKRKQVRRIEEEDLKRLAQILPANAPTEYKTLAQRLRTKLRA